MDWAQTHHNLAIALQDQGRRTEGPEGASLLYEARAACLQTLTVYTREDHAVYWAMTRENAALAEEALADDGTTAVRAPHLRAALEHAEAALTGYDPAHMPERHHAAAALRDRLRARLAT